LGAITAAHVATALVSLPAVFSTAAAAAPVPARADASRASRPSGVAPPRAPSGPPLTQAGSPSAVSPASEGGTASATQGDPLVGNGLGSPLCSRRNELPAVTRSHCETSDFVAGAAPTGNYGIDVHINTGLFGLSSGGLLSVVQDLFVTPLWTALVWAVHALVVMLEWAFSLDLLAIDATGGLSARLRQMQAAMTEPWLPLALAVASSLAVYRGLVLRRVGEAMAQSTVMCLMMLAALWLIADPRGTVGAVAQWADQASIGTLATAARGSPAGGTGALAASMADVFAAAVEGPWCYMEFGSVAWCRDPERRDPALRSAALKIAAGELALIGCKPGALSYESCTAPGSDAARALERSARLLREAGTNGAMFLALPANGAARNSINESGSLLRALCRTNDATHCVGPSAAAAEFRTDGGTWARVAGLLLIIAGAVGMLLLLGFIALQLLTAALFSLLYLLLAPAMVLAPAFGDAGHAAFRRWSASLAAAVMSKLVFALLLGVVLAVLTILASLPVGWWMQWLLMSAFWWGAFSRRHRAFALVDGAHWHEGGTRGPSLTRAAGSLREPRRALARSGGRMLAKDGPPLTGRRAWTRPPAAPRLPPGALQSSLSRIDRQAARSARHERRDALAVLRDAPQIEEAIRNSEERLFRLGRAHLGADLTGNTRRALEINHRAERLQEELVADAGRLAYARRALAGREAPDDTVSPARVRELSDLFDEQARLPPARAAAGAGRDYASLAPLAGVGRTEYEALSPSAKRGVRVEVDRELGERAARVPPARAGSEESGGGASDEHVDPTHESR
jgi:hypothetical protein